MSTTDFIPYNLFTCSFCHKTEEEVFYLVRSGMAAICDECTDAAAVYVQAERAKLKGTSLTLHGKTSPDGQNTLTALHIKAALDETIIGQDHAKKILSVVAANHLKRIAASKGGSGAVLPKNNVLLIGPTGTGKTYLIQQLGKILNIPIVIGDASRITQSGYIGDKVDDLFFQLLENANRDKFAAQFGIIYLDEVDKLASSNDRVNETGGRRVQEDLLRSMEGSDVTATQWDGGHSKRFAIPTDNILFIFGGAFVGLEDIIRQRTQATGMGFTASVKDSKNSEKRINLEQHLQTEDLIQFGFIPEFLGRISSYGLLADLTEEDLYHILLDTKGSVVEQYKSLFQMDNINLNILPGALKLIAREAIQKKIGARGLKASFERLLLDHLYNVSENPDTREIVIDADMTSDVPKFNSFKR